MAFQGRCLLAIVCNPLRVAERGVNMVEGGVSLARVCVFGAVCCMGMLPGGATDFRWPWHPLRSRENWDSFSKFRTLL